MCSFSKKVVRPRTVDSVLMLWTESNPSTMEKNHLILSGLAEHGVAVSALGLCYSDTYRKYFESVYGRHAKYEYDLGTKGSLFEGRNYASKLLNNLKLALLFSYKLIHVMMTKSVSVVIVPPQPIELTLPAAILCRILGAKFVPNIMEYYPALPAYHSRKNVFQRWSWGLVLRRADGFIVISKYLEEKLSSSVVTPAFRLPAILPDVAVGVESDPEKAVSSIKNRIPILLYTSSKAYDDLLDFSIRATAYLTNQQFILMITGEYPDQERLKWLRLASSLGIDGRVEFTGFLTDAELLDLQLRSAALLMPLLDSDRHRARFPQKVLSYMQLARPIITTKVGEFALNFKDNETVVMDGDVTIPSYANKIRLVLGKPDQLKSIGLRGRDFVVERFGYRYWGGELKHFLSRLS